MSLERSKFHGGSGDRSSSIVQGVPRWSPGMIHSKRAKLTLWECNFTLLNWESDMILRPRVKAKPIAVYIQLFLDLCHCKIASLIHFVCQYVCLMSVCLLIKAKIGLVRMDGKSILQIPDTGAQVLDNTTPFLRSSIVSFWITPAHCKER